MLTSKESSRKYAYIILTPSTPAKPKFYIVKLIKDKLIDKINQTFIQKNTQSLACNEECDFFFISDVYNYLWSCQKDCDALAYLLDNIFIRFGTELCRQTIGIPM